METKILNILKQIMNQKEFIPLHILIFEGNEIEYVSESLKYMRRGQDFAFSKRIC